MPGILCLPYIRERSKSDMEAVYEKSFESTDLYIKEPNPSASDIRLFSQEKFRFVYESVKMDEYFGVICARHFGQNVPV